jgi:hypothetical protein
MAGAIVFLVRWAATESTFSSAISHHDLFRGNQYVLRGFIAVYPILIFKKNCCEQFKMVSLCARNK